MTLEEKLAELGVSIVEDEDLLPIEKKSRGPKKKEAKLVLEEEGEEELNWDSPSEGDIILYRIVMCSMNRKRVPDKMRERLEQGADVIESALSEGYLPKWVLRKFERWVELWYGPGNAKYGFPETILDWKSRR